jgi:hypothetical protein
MPPLLSGRSIAGKTVQAGKWQLVTPDGEAEITWYEIRSFDDYKDPNDLPDQARWRMQGSVKVGGKNYYWLNGKWNESNLDCEYANSQHCVYPYENTPNGYVFTGAVSPEGDIPVGYDQYVYIQVYGTDPRIVNDTVFGDSKQLVNSYDGCPACVPNGGIDLLTTDASTHYSYNRGSGAMHADVYIWVWVPVPTFASTPYHYLNGVPAR